MYVLIFPLNNWDWLWLGMAIALDIFTYTSGVYKRKAIPYYPETAP
jgi:accessory gene regulator protein AgrB